MEKDGGPLFFLARTGDNRPLRMDEAFVLPSLWFVAQSRPPSLFLKVLTILAVWPLLPTGAKPPASSILR